MLDRVLFVLTGVVVATRLLLARVLNWMSGPFAAENVMSEVKERVGKI